MMAAPLAGLRVVEFSAFIAAPLGGMTLAQLGAEVIRIDPLGGNIDYRRMPRAPGGDSIYWASLNKGKKSVALALDTPRGQEIARRIVCAPGSDAGILLTNLPARGWMDGANLRQHRPDLITVRLTGNYDGSSAMDYTVNCASGFPVATGATRQPVNHVLPAWDVAAGLYIAVGLLAAERLRRSTGQGQEIKLALSDVMLATVANLGYVADVQVNGVSREPIGNDLYGAFGRNFATADGRELMIVAISKKQWQAIGKATGLTDRLAMIGPMLGVDLATEEGLFEARDAIAAVLKPWFAKKTLSEAGHALDVAQVLWGPYQDFGQLVRYDPRCSTANPMFGELDQPGIGRVLSPRSPLAFSPGTTPAPLAAPALGADTASVLQSLLGLSPDELVRLEQQDIVGTSIHSIR
jgi:2-methylfumaryl-CoA isomerase